MLGSIFYHNLTRKYCITFGNMFRDIVIRRFDKDMNTLQTIPVPIRYGAKQKYIQMLLRPQEDEKVQVQLPTMSFLMTGFNYVENRQISPLNNTFYHINNTKKLVREQLHPQPYDLEFELGIFTRNHDDAWQIIEQILPYFVPTFNNEVLLVPEMNQRLDIKTTYTGMSFSEDFEGGPEEPKMVQATMNFQMAVWFFGPVSNTGLIKRVQVDLIPLPGGGRVIDTPNYTDYGRAERLVVTPGLTANGTPTTDSSLSIPYDEIDFDDPYGFAEDVYHFDDGKKYDPKTGTDK